LVIVADDAGWNDVGYNGSEIETPNIDFLARNGIQLDRFYTAPTCSPSRAAFLTGMPASRMGIVAPISGRSEKALPDSLVTLPQALQEAGYKTALMGKWHLGLKPESGPKTYGFNYSYGFLHGQIDHYAHTYKNGDKSWHRNGRFIEEEGHATDLITRETINWLTEKRDPSKSFFLQIAYSAPHVPLQEEKKWKARYKEVISDSSRRNYAAAMTHMDFSIGQIIETLEKEELTQNTLILFMSDNGAQKEWYPDQQYDGKYGPNPTLGSNYPLRGWKTSNYEGGIRVPAVLYWKDHLEHSKLKEPISITDWMPTFLELAGVEKKPAHIEGKSIKDLIYGEGKRQNRTIYVRGHLQESIINGKWKIIRTRYEKKESKYELYQVEKDPEEEHNLITEHPQIAFMLKQKLKQEFQKDADEVNFGM
jgi:arylsulfatase A-like enzyme